MVFYTHSIKTYHFAAEVPHFFTQNTVLHWCCQKMTDLCSEMVCVYRMCEKNHIKVIVFEALFYRAKKRSASLQRQLNFWKNVDITREVLHVWHVTAKSAAPPMQYSSFSRNRAVAAAMRSFFWLYKKKGVENNNFYVVFAHSINACHFAAEVCHFSQNPCNTVFCAKKWETSAAKW